MILIHFGSCGNNEIQVSYCSVRYEKHFIIIISVVNYNKLTINRNAQKEFPIGHKSIIIKPLLSINYSGIKKPSMRYFNIIINIASRGKLFIMPINGRLTSNQRFIVYFSLALVSLTTV